MNGGFQLSNQVFQRISNTFPNYIQPDISHNLQKVHMEQKGSQQRFFSMVQTCKVYQWFSKNFAVSLKKRERTFEKIHQQSYRER